MKNKGVSPVVATILLMGIAIAAASSAAVVITGSMDDMQQSVEDWLRQEDKKEATSLSADFGYNGTDGRLLIDVSNDGSRSVRIAESSGEKNIRMYVNGTPEDWEYVSGTVNIIDPGDSLTVNTTLDFPEDDESVEVEFSGPYGIDTGYICYSQGGSCT